MKHSSEISPPKEFTRFLRWFCRSEYYEDIQGDLEEEFQLLYQANNSLRKANYWYRFQVLKLFKPTMMKKTQTQNLIETQTLMFRNHLKIGYRNLWKYKSGTAINLAGLAIGISAFILITLFIKDELSYDRHHEHADEIYRVTVKNFTPDGSLTRHWAFASAGHAERLKEDYSSITHAVRFYPWAFPDIEFEEQKLNGQQVIFADNDVFDIFTFPFIIGDPTKAFDGVLSIVLTEETAIRIFGNDWREKNVLNQALKLSRDGEEASFKITGVMKNMPDQQHFHFEYLAPIRFIEQIMGKDEMNNVGGNYNWMTYVRFAPETDAKAFQNDSHSFFEKYIKGNALESNRYDFVFQPLTDIHLKSNLESEIETNGSIQQVYIFGIVGILLLLVACINYMNLATSHYSRRMKEVGVRKAVGANRSTLLSQFLTESLLITFFTIPLVLIIVFYGLPFINDFVDKNLTFNLIENIELLGGLVILTLLVGVLAGLYPALFLSRINLLKSLKGESSIRSTKWNFRNWLVTFQYTVTIALIFSILVIKSQINFIQQSDPGYQKNQILKLWTGRNIANPKILKRELMNNPNIEMATLSSMIPTRRLLNNQGSSFFKGDSLVRSQFRLPCVSVDEDFLDTYEIELIAGENFDKSMEMYEDSTGYYIINRKAAEAMGYQDPNKIVGAKLSYGDFNGGLFKIGNIVGVVEDFHFESMHSPIVPMVMLKTAHNSRELSIKIKKGDIQNTLRDIETTFAKFDTENVADYQFVDELFDEQYRQEERLGDMINLFTFLTIFVCSLGLIGMVGFIIETKTKEIGIRKVLGASIQSIILMISNQFFILIGIAFILALPVAYWLMQNWLDDFEYHTDISPFIIISPLIITCLFTITMLAYQSIKASFVNPVESLKDE